MPSRLVLLLVPLLVGARPAAATPAAPVTVLLVGSPSRPVERAVSGGLRQRRLGLVRAAAFVGPALAASDDPDQAVVKRVEASLDRAQKLFYGVRIDEAAELLSAEGRSAGEALARSRRLDLLRAVHLWLGVCLLKKSDVPGARRAFAAAVLLDDRPPDDVRFAPTVIATFAAVRKELEAQARGLLEVRPTPRTATLSLDGRRLSARSVRLSSGPHWLLGEALGHLPVAREVRVAAGATTRVDLSLAPADEHLLRRQLHALAARGELHVLVPEIALALCRLQRADEALLVDEQRDGSRLKLSFTRLSCPSGQILGKQEETAAPEGKERAVERALSTLWPLAPLVSRSVQRSASPVYRRWWFWTVIGLGAAAVVGGTVGGVLAARSGPDYYRIRVAP